MEERAKDHRAEPCWDLRTQYTRLCVERINRLSFRFITRFQISLITLKESAKASKVVNVALKKTGNVSLRINARLEYEDKFMLVSIQTGDVGGFFLVCV